MDAIESALGEVECTDLNVAYTQNVYAAVRQRLPDAVLDVYFTPDALYVSARSQDNVAVVRIG